MGFLRGDEKCRHGNTKRGCSPCQGRYHRKEHDLEPMQGTFKTGIFGGTKYEPGSKRKGKKERSPWA